MNIILVLVVALLVAERNVEADFSYNRVLPKTEDLKTLGLKCIPGRTVIRVEEKKAIPTSDSEEDDDEEDTRRTHMNADNEFETCQVCVCSVEGKDEYCSRRPARNVNECIRMSMIKDEFERHLPFSHERSLAFRIRRVGSDLADSKCIPYVSEYSDCSAANVCTGCKRCSCDAEGNWACRRVIECPQVDENEAVDDLMLENALNNLYSGMEIKKTKRIPGALVPEPAKPEDDLLLVPEIKFDVEGELKSLFTRQKRSSDDERDNGTVKFYETVDDMNEDTLKSSNISGTLKANKINTEATSSRRAGVLGQNNASNLTPLHIKYNEPHEFEHHVAENKVDSKHPLEDKINGLSHEEIHRMLGNYSQSIKNNDLSKLVVNEMIRGSEIIGDKNVQPLSNITFTPENDTITAMAFIAGNLLNKLWDLDTGEDSFETEEIKHKKINDLLELFKEPLSIRQENFLKNALEKLSQVIDSKQDVKNVTLCTNFEETDISKPKQSNCTEKSTYNHKEKQAALGHKNKSNLDKEKRAQSDAVRRINDVLNLIKKYEHIQNSLGNLKNVQIESNIKQPSVIKEKALSSDENISLNLYGNILSKITNLLSPEKKFKKIIKKINSYHMTRQDEKPKKDLEKVFGFDLGNLTMSSKDKLITDYLRNIEKHPNCFFSNLQQPVLSELPNIEGNILYNLSEFFKIKSFADLLNLVKNKSDNVNIQSTTASATTNNPTFMTQSTINTNEKYLKTSLKSEPSKLLSVKEKLKNDLKTILQDLVELQTEHGLKPKSKINIADALPCIYNILNTDINMKNKASVNSIEKIKSFMDALKSEMKFTFLNRRSNVVITQRPKSAVVWERAIKNLNKRNKPATRRYLGQDKKTYKELKDMMDNVELSSNLYKNIAIQRGVTPSERLVLLKTLQADINQYTEVLKNINKSLETVINLPIEKQNEFNEFIDNAAININLNRKVVEVTEKTKGNMVENITPRVLLPTNAMYSIENKQSLVMPKWMDSNENHFKLRRAEVINQLIMNRLKLYIKKKENSGADFNADINYSLAKRILYNLEIGNSALAKELFEVFMASEKPKRNYDQQNLKEYKNPVVDKRMESRGPSLLAFREPLVKVEDPKRIKMLSPDHFWKQLWNLENIKEQ